MTERWYKQYRLNWIAESLRVYGFINREHLEKKFGISTTQAAKDFTEFQNTYPDAMRYDLSAKKYFANESTK